MIFDTIHLERLRMDWRRLMLKYANKSLYWKCRYYYGNIQYRTLLYWRLFHVSRSRILKRIFYNRYRTMSILSGVEIVASVTLGGNAVELRAAAPAILS
jgi:hypothetical protein